MTLVRRITDFAGSMAGRIFVMLTIGMTIASATSLVLAERARRQDFERLRIERVAASAIDIAGRLARQPKRIGPLLAAREILGAHPAPADVAIVQPDARLTALIARGLGPRSTPEAGQVPTSLCFGRQVFGASRRAAGVADDPVPDCWLVRLTDADGNRQALAIDLPPFVLPPSSALDPIYLLILVAASALFALIVARFAATPIRRLAEATRAVSISSDPEPLPESGPTEVRAALRAFNVMQGRIREGVRDRTQVLAAISHDLQTPLTRLRLRLEHVSDPELRDRLASDVVATQRLVREGLDLARAGESREPFSNVDLDSLISSLVEDNAEFGAPVTFTGGCGATVRVKPDALARCLGNLIDNALKYGGDADVTCARHGNMIVVAVRDHGPGIAPDAIATMFQPFQRGDNSRSRTTGGTGIGLTIARAQATTFGGTIALTNCADGGLLATVSFPAA